jgi:preprotein translocase subunit YajC
MGIPPMTALVQATTGGGVGTADLLWIQIPLILLVLWFFIIRPQSQARKKHAELLGQLKKGDEVMTVGGIVGVVREIRELKERNETRVTIETGTAQVVVERSRIVRVGGETAPGATPA